jgi:hypothetical protein
MSPEFDAESDKSFISNKTIPAPEPNEPKGKQPIQDAQPAPASKYQTNPIFLPTQTK